MNRFILRILPFHTRLSKLNVKNSPVHFCPLVKQLMKYKFCYKLEKETQVKFYKTMGLSFMYLNYSINKEKPF